MTDMGLRERKKARTRAAIQEHAMRLFRDQGYDETTVDQIAAAAEVSPATFFRYFPTKEDTVLFDALDPMLMEMFRKQPAEMSPIEALRATLRDGYAAMTPEQLNTEEVRQQLIRSAPGLRMRMLEQFYNTIDMLAVLAAERVGRDTDDSAVRAWAGAVVGVLMAATQQRAGSGDWSLADSFEVIDKALAQLEAGLPF